MERQACVQVTNNLEDQGPWLCGSGGVLGNRYMGMWRLGGREDGKGQKSS